MIENEHELKVTEGCIARFREMLSELRATPPPNANQRLWEIRRVAAAAQLAELEEQAAIYRAARGLGPREGHA
jgi:hypothetical protein